MCYCDSALLDGNPPPNFKAQRRTGSYDTQIENDYDKDVYNGDIGYIDDVDPDAGELTASFDGRAVPHCSKKRRRPLHPHAARGD